MCLVCTPRLDLACVAGWWRSCRRPAVRATAAPQHQAAAAAAPLCVAARGRRQQQHEGSSGSIIIGSCPPGVESRHAAGAARVRPPQWRNANLQRKVGVMVALWLSRGHAGRHVERQLSRECPTDEQRVGCCCACRYHKQGSSGRSNNNMLQPAGSLASSMSNLHSMHSSVRLGRASGSGATLSAAGSSGSGAGSPHRKGGGHYVSPYGQQQLQQQQQRR